MDAMIRTGRFWRRWQYSPGGLGSRTRRRPRSRPTKAAFVCSSPHNVCPSSVVRPQFKEARHGTTEVPIPPARFCRFRCLHRPAAPRASTSRTARLAAGTRPTRRRQIARADRGVTRGSGGCYRHAMLPIAAIVGIAGITLTEDERELFRAHPPAGVILFARNIGDPEGLRLLVNTLRRVLPAEAVLMVDQEGGRVARLREPHWRDHPPAAAHGMLFARDPTAGLRATWLTGALIGLDCADVGFDVVCAPVLDRRLPGAHSVIGDRAFAEAPHDVAQLGRALAEGLLAAGVQPGGQARARAWPGRGGQPSGTAGGDRRGSGIGLAAVCRQRGSALDDDCPHPLSGAGPPSCRPPSPLSS